MSETNKSVLVIDTPNNCNECRFCKHEYPYPYCRITINSMNNLNIKPDWCPLSPLPEKTDLQPYIDAITKDIENDDYSLNNVSLYHYARGWNACREAILKGEK